MKQFGKVEIPQEAFIGVLKLIKKLNKLFFIVKTSSGFIFHRI